MANVTSIFTDATNPGLTTPISPRKAILIFGLATKGPMYQRIKITPETVGDIFGNIPDYTDEDQKDFYNRSLVKEAYDLFTLIWDYQGQALTEYDFYGVRIGQARSATITLNEITLKDNGNENLTVKPSITITAIEANEEANSWYVKVDGVGSPQSMTITCGTITDTIYFSNTASYDSKTFTNILDAANYLNNTSDLSKYLSFSVETIETSSTIVVTDAGGSVPERDYNLYSDAEDGSTFHLSRPIKSIISASVVGTTEYTSTEIGLSVLSLTKTPVKPDSNSTIKTSKFVITNEIPFTVGVTDIGGNSKTVTLALATDTIYKASTPNVAFTSVIKVSGSTQTTLTTDDTDDDYYAFTAGTNEITFHNVNGFVLGDQYKVSYTYDITLVEAKTSADIVPSVRNQYFVYGNEIRFNNALPNIVRITYDSNTLLNEYNDFVLTESTGDITIQSAVDISIGDKLVFIFDTIPAFPDITSVNTYLTGGTSDARISETTYRDVIIRGLNASYGWVARYILVAGMYIDSQASIIDSVTGKPTLKLVDYLARIKDYLDYKNKNVSHCECVIGNKRFEAENYTNLTKARHNYISNLISISSTFKNNVAEATVGFSSMFIILAIHMGEKINPSIRPATMSKYVDAATHILAAKILVSLTSPIGYPITTLQKAPSAISGIAFDTDVNMFNRMKNMRYTFAYYYYQLDGSVVIRYYDAPTAAAPKSQYRRQGLNAVLYDAIDRCRAFVNPHLGKPVGDNGVALKLGLNNLIRDYYVKTGILGGAEVTISFTGDTITKEAKIGLKVYSLAELVGAEITTSVDAGEVVEK